MELGGRLLDQGATLAAPTLGSTVRSGSAARPARCRADTCRWMGPRFLFCDRSAGGEEGPLGATGRGNLRTLCPGQALGTVLRRGCAGQMSSSTAGLGGALNPGIATPAPYLVVEPDDGL